MKEEWIYNEEQERKRNSKEKHSSLENVGEKKRRVDEKSGLKIDSREFQLRHAYMQRWKRRQDALVLLLLLLQKAKKGSNTQQTVGRTEHDDEVEKSR